MNKSIILSAVIALSATFVQAQCTASFSVSQAATPVRGPEPWHIQVTDGSTGSNLTYVWDFGDGTGATAPSPVHQYSGTGPYVLCLTVISPATTTTPACTSATFCDTISVDSMGYLLKTAGAQGLTLTINDGASGSVTGIEKAVQESLEFSVAPNPSATFTQVTLQAEENGNAVIEIYNMNGQLVESMQRSMTVGANTYKLDVSSFGKGMYLLKMRAGDRTASTVIIRE